MSENKLPVLSIFLEALSLPKKHSKDLVKVGWPLIIVGTITILSDIFFYNTEESLFSVSRVVLSLVYLFSLTMTVVGVHRVFLMESHSMEELGLLNWTGNEVSYAGWWILIGICATVIFMGTIFVVNPLISSLLGSTVEERISVGTRYILLWLMAIPVLYFVSRWSLVLPASAIGKDSVGLSWSWEMTKGNSWRLTILIGGPYLLSIIFDLLPSYDSVVYSFLLGVIWLIAGVIQVGILSLSYAYLMQFESKEGGSKVTVSTN